MVWSAALSASGQKPRREKRGHFCGGGGLGIGVVVFCSVFKKK